MCTRPRAALLAAFLLAGCGAPSTAPLEGGPWPGHAFVVRAEGDGTARPDRAPAGAYLLRSLDDSTRWVRFDPVRSAAEARRGGGEPYRLVLRTRGPAPLPTHAVFAEWRLDDASAAPRFERSREELFALRADHLESFHADLLFRSLRDPARYLVLGLYAGEEGLRQARAHPRIRAFADQNPPSRFGARDLFGVRNFRIVRE